MLVVGISKVDVINNWINYFFDYDYVINGLIMFEIEEWILKGLLS